MVFSTFPNNPFPPSSSQFNEGKNDFIQAEIDAMKDGASIDSFGDVETALATKTNLSNIAPAFDATSGVYAVGDKVIYNGVLYEFTSAHSTAGEWDESEVQPVKISELIDSLKNGLTGLLTAFPSGTAQVRNLIVNGTGFNNAGVDIFNALPIDNVNKFVYGLHIADGTRAFFGVVYGQQNYASIIILHYNGSINVQTFANGAWTQKAIPTS